VREKDKRKSKTTNTHIHEQREIEGKNSVKKQNHHQTAHTTTTRTVIKKKARKVVCFSNFLDFPSLCFSNNKLKGRGKERSDQR